MSSQRRSAGKLSRGRYRLRAGQNTRLLLIRLLCLSLLLGRRLTHRLEHALFGLKAIAQTVRDHLAGEPQVIAALTFGAEHIGNRLGGRLFRPLIRLGGSEFSHRPQ